MSEHKHRQLDADMIAEIIRPPELRILQVAEVRYRVGEGCCIDDPVREVVAYYSMEGEVLAVNDRWAAS